MCTYVTFENLFVFTQTLFSLVTVIASVITLVIEIAKLCSSGKDTKKRKK